MNLTNRFNKNLDRIEVSLIRQFDQSISKIPGILRLTLGEPDFTTPNHVKEAAKLAIDNNHSYYTGMSGLLELRKAASQFVKEKYNLQYDPEDEILVTIGATEALSATFLSFFFSFCDWHLKKSSFFPANTPVQYIGAVYNQMSTTNYLENDNLITKFSYPFSV